MDKKTSEDQIEKQTLTPAGIRRKKHMVSVPLRRSERCKTQASSSSQVSKAETSRGSPPSDGMKRNKDKMGENSSRPSTSGTVEACEGEKDEITSPEIKITRMRASAYKALFQKQEKKVKASGQLAELDAIDNPSIKDGSNSGDRTQKNGAAAGEIGHITGGDSLPDQEAVQDSGEPEAGTYIKPCEKSAQPLVSLHIKGNDSAAVVERFSRCTAAESKVNSSQFMEYWVPAQMSHVQLEQYCSILVKSPSLRSSSRTDPVGVGALRDILTATRKCCDHPYLVDSTLQSFLTKDVEPTQIMDIGIQASGKLELLDKFLVEMRTRGLRALILFQNIGSFGEKDSITVGDILDDVVRQRFGEKSYERIDGGLARPKIQTAVNNFNNRKLEMFVFLIEARACRPFIKLSSVDVVVIFGSDWQPANDIRNLQKMTLESDSKNIKVFRLYSCFTVEEKVLISSKKGLNMDGRVQDRTPSICHMLLMWEATYLFNKLNEFHCSYSQSSRLILSDPKSTEDVVMELLTFLPVEENNLRSSSMVVRVENDGNCYKMEFPLYGESKRQLPDGESLSPPTFWTKLLDGKYHRWKYLSGSSQRNRRQNIHLYGTDANEVGKKRKKLADNQGVQSPRKRGKGKIAGEKGPSGSPPTPEQDLENCKNGLEEARKLCDSQRSLSQSLQHEISRICEVLNLGDKVKNMTEKFLDYVINNHHVTREPTTILQAFQLALCWTAASILKVKVDHKESFQLVKTYMSYGCKKEEADLVYRMLRDLKKMFLEQRSTDMGDVEDLSSSKEDVKEGILNAVKKIKKEYGEHMEKLMQQQKKEIDEVQKAYEAERATLENKRQIEASVIRFQYCEGPTRTDKLNILEGDITVKIEERKNQMTAQLNQLERTHHVSRTKLHLKEFFHIISFKKWARTKLVNVVNAQTSGGPNVVEGRDDPTNVNICSLSESGFGLSEVPEGPCAVSNACESFSEGLVDEDPHNCISADPCVGEIVGDGVTNDQVIPLPNSETADAVSQNVQPLQSQIPDRKIADEATEMIIADETADTVFQDEQPLQSQILNRTIADEATEMIVADDFTSVVEKGISGTPNDQASHSNEFDDSIEVEPLAPRASAPTVLPEEPRDQPNESCTPRTTQGEVALLIEQINACAPVSSNSDATPPDQLDSESANAELTPSVRDLFLVDAAAYSSLEAQNSMNFLPTRPFEEVLEPQMNSVQGNQTPAIGHGTMPPQSSFPSAQSSNLMSSETCDPLQIEIERIHKEDGLRIKDHENLKMELKLECEKEIERTISQIRLKYKAKEQEAEELNEHKKKELEAAREQVNMNNILAAAFRLYTDFGTPEASSQPDSFSDLQQQIMLPQSNLASFPCIPSLFGAQTSTMRESINPVQQLLAQQLLRHNTHTSPALFSAQTSTMQQSVNPVQQLQAQQLGHNTPALFSAQTSTMQQSVNPVQQLQAQQLGHNTPALFSAQTSTMQQSVNPVQQLQAQQLGHNTPALLSAQTSTMQQSVNPVQQLQAQQLSHNTPALFSAQTSTMQQSVNLGQQLQAQQHSHNTTSSLHTSAALFSAQISTMQNSVNTVLGLPAQQLLHHNAPIRSFTPVNVQVRGNKRAPATFLQPYRTRPSVPASLPSRGTYQAINLPPSTTSHCPVSVAAGAAELLLGQHNPTQMDADDSVWIDPSWFFGLSDE